MAYDEALADRVREVIGARFDERKMFGGIAFMVAGNMAVGVINDDLMVRVGKDGYDAALARAHVRQMDFTGKPLSGFVYVGPKGVKDKRSLSAWVKRGVTHAQSLPKKKAKR